MTEPTSRVLIDNDEVRVSRFRLTGEEDTGAHRHAHDYVVVPLAPGRMRVTDADGTVSVHVVREGEPYFRPAGAEHTVSSDGPEPLDFVEVELLRPAPTGPAAPGAPAHAPPRVRPVRAGDHPRWRELYRGYADFYGVEQPEENAERVWSWIHDPDHEVQGLVAEDATGEVIGLAHYRPFARPLSATVGCWLDDLFVDPGSRGGGAADALLAELAAIAAERGWSVVRWITADDNHRARAKYDQVASRTAWVTYDMPPAAHPEQR